MKFWSGDKIEKLQENQIFVFGSNPQGRHGSGGAKAAMSFGAKYGVGRGLMGQTYALVTKNLDDNVGFIEKKTGIVYEKGGFRSVSPEMIIENIKEMYECARNNPHLQFIVTYKRELLESGAEKKSLNGYTPTEMIDMFVAADIPDNMVFHNSYKELINLKLSQKKQEKEKIFENSNYVFSFYSHKFHKQYPSLFMYKDKNFVSLEHFMVYSKIKMFNDVSAEKELNKLLEKDMIVDFKSGKINAGDILNNVIKSKEWTLLMNDMKMIGKKCLNFNQGIWEQKKMSIMTVGNREKIFQNKDIYEESLKVNGRNIIFANQYSKNSGIGLSADNPDIKNMNLWQGKNELGYSLNQSINLLLQTNKKRIQP